ncbi:MAG: hypothetical protein BGO09_11205 [Bacteroidetes bacterium 47-18]|mgnify:FL=1|nr:MAG: hypothetical protein BGO09_11205 [Bacteroidetes bacterium 47-18]
MIPMTNALLFIINPKSGTDRVKALSETIREALGSHFDIDIRLTEYAGHATALSAAAADRNYAGVVAVGGDGSVNEVAQSLVGTETALGILPKGSGNGLARSLEIDLDTKEALGIIRKGNTDRIDVGYVNESHYFLSNLGVGFDVQISRDFSESQWRGFWGYTKVVADNLLGYNVKSFELTIDEQPPRIVYSFLLNIANAEQFGFNFKIAPAADLQDGLLDIVSVKKFPLWLGGDIILKAFTGHLYDSKYTDKWQGKHIVIKSPSLDYYQVDGDLIRNSTPGTVSVSVLPGALKVFKP